MATTEEIEEVRRRAQEAANVYERTLSEDGVDADVIQSLLGSTSHQNGDDHLARMRRTRSDDTVLHSDSRMKETKEQVPATTPTNPGQGPRSRGRLSSADHRDRDSFFALVSHHPSLDALRDQRSLGPPLGRQYYSPGELADEENQSQPSSPSSTTNSRQSPLHWLVKMGVSEHDGNVPISIRRPRKEERATSPSPKRGKLQSSAIFRRLRAATSEMALDKAEAERLKKRSFAHYDTQSMAFNLGKSPMNSPSDVTKNTGASGLSQVWDEVDEGDHVSNDLVLTCSFFRNEISQSSKPEVKSNGMYISRTGSIQRRRVSRAGDTVLESKERGEPEGAESRPSNGMSWLLREGDNVHDPEQSMFEFVDYGALYYRKFFCGHDHQNYLGLDENHGPVAISLRRETMESQSGKDRYQYRLIVRTSDLVALRGSIPEDSIPGSSKPTNRGLPAKDVLDFVVGGDVQLSCLRLAQTGNKVPERLLRLDEEGLSLTYRMGIMYCKDGQSTEDEMYGNEHGSPAFDYFLSQLGDKVTLRGFQGYRAQLDNKTDSTGTHSVHTSFHGCEIMFHVSTLLPYTPNNQQQVLRKRHIGNDIVTIVFQEPGAKPFSPKVIRSQFQHVFIIVRVHNPESDKPQYSVAVSRSMHVPCFGPELPPYGRFDPGAGLKEFLLTKAINSENAARRSARFAAMAMRTRKEYLEDLARNYATSQTLDSAFGLYGKLFSRSGGPKKKEKLKPYLSLETAVRGAITWDVEAETFGALPDGKNIPCVFGISVDSVVLVDDSTKETVFSIPSKTVIGWTSKDDNIKLYYNTGDFVMLRLPRGADQSDIQEMVKRLAAVSSGVETHEITLRRNATGQLGFSIQLNGLVGNVDQYQYAWQAGLRSGARVVEIGDIPVCSLDHEQTVEYLRVAGSVKVMVIPALDGQPRGSQLQRQLSWTSLFPQIMSEPVDNEPEEEKASIMIRNRVSNGQRRNSADRIFRRKQTRSSTGSLQQITREAPWYHTSSEEEGTDEDKSSLDQSSYISSEPQDNDANSSLAVSLTSSVSSLPAQPHSETGLGVDDVQLTVVSGEVIELEETHGNEDGEQVVPEKVERERKGIVRPHPRIRPQLSLVSISTLEEPRHATITGVAHSVYPESCLSPTILRQDTIQRISTSRSSPLLRRNSEDERRMADSEMMNLVSQSMKQISDMEQQVQHLTSQLKDTSIENERLRRQLASERLENEALREEARHAASELRQFTDWFYQQQFRTLTQEDY